MRILYLSVVISLLIISSCALDNGLGLTPQMGWNTWNKFGCNINETVIKEAADQIKSLGLDKLGYKYVNIDDCWNLEERDAEGH